MGKYKKYAKTDQNNEQTNKNLPNDLTNNNNHINKIENNNAEFNNKNDYFIPDQNITNQNKINPKIKNQYPQNQKIQKPKPNNYNSNNFFPKKESHSLNKSPKSSERAQKRKLSPGINNYYNPDPFDSKINKKISKRINTSNSKEKSFNNITYFPDGNCWACDLGCSVSTTGYSPMTFSPYKNNFRRRNVTPVKQGVKYEQYTRHKKSGRNNSYMN